MSHSWTALTDAKRLIFEDNSPGSHAVITHACLQNPQSLCSGECTWTGYACTNKEPKPNWEENYSPHDGKSALPYQLNMEKFDTWTNEFIQTLSIYQFPLQIKIDRLIFPYPKMMIPNMLQGVDKITVIRAVTMSSKAWKYQKDTLRAVVSGRVLWKLCAPKYRKEWFTQEVIRANEHVEKFPIPCSLSEHIVGKGKRLLLLNSSTFEQKEDHARNFATGSDVKTFKQCILKIRLDVDFPGALMDQDTDIAALEQVYKDT